MDQKFLNARSPLRLLEKGLHGGLGAGNLGIVLAGHGVGKTSFLVGVAMDELLREGRVLHVSLSHSVAHVRAHYDTVYEELANSKHLEDQRLIHRDVDAHRSVRVYPPGSLTVAKLREAVETESQAAGPPSLIIIEGANLSEMSRAEAMELKSLANELDAEIWLESASSDEREVSATPEVEAIDDLLSVVLALEPTDGVMKLRAIKDHDNPDVSDLHVSLDPRTLLLVRS